MSEENVHYIPPPSGPKLTIPILFGVVIALLVATVYLFLQLDQMRTEMASLRDSLLDEVSSVREASSVTNQTQQRRLESLREELEAAQRQAAMAAGNAKAAATKRAEELAKQLAEEQEQVRLAQQRQAEELDQVAARTSENKSFIGQVEEKVTETRSELDKTIGQLTSVTGDLGVQSGLIATNAKELAALKALGDRDYFEFDINKSKTPSKVADISLTLKDTNDKKGWFTVVVVADDRAVEKRKRNVNEPLQFYTSSARQPYELVVNKVEKNRIVGYLAVPKIKKPRGTESAAASS